LLRVRPSFHVQYYRRCHSKRSRLYLESPARTTHTLSQKLVRGLGARGKQASRLSEDASISSGTLVTMTLLRQPYRRHRMSKTSTMSTAQLRPGGKKSLTGPVANIPLSRAGKVFPYGPRVRFHIWAVTELTDITGVHRTNPVPPVLRMIRHNHDI
jgi:hypothetical protein